MCGTVRVCVCVCVCVRAQPLSSAQLFATPWTIAHQAPLPMGIVGQKNWSGLPFPPPGDLPEPGIKLTSPSLTDGSIPLSHQGSPRMLNKYMKNTSSLSPFLPPPKTIT